MEKKGNKDTARRIGLTVALFIFLSCLPAIAQFNENIIKAAYIERITRFIEWPSGESLPASDQFVIGVYGENELYSALIEVFKEKLIKEHKVRIIAIKSPEQINDCNLCYISQKAKPMINAIIATANSSGVLLFAETDGFCKAGVHINFYIEDEKLKFEINETSLATGGFKVSYLLMQNTKIIR
jgi:hypothetical protein